MNRDILTISQLLKAITLLLSFAVTGCSLTDNPDGGFGADNSSGKAGTTLSTKSFTEAVSSASQLQQKGDLNKALYYYIEALQHEPKNANVYVHIADIHVQLGNDSIAGRAYLQAVELDPSLTLAHQGLGSIEMDNRNHQQAKIHLQQAILLDQMRLNKKGASKLNNYYALDSNSPIKSYISSGIIEDMQRNFTSARIYYQLALNQNKKSANILSNLGYSYYLTGELKAAESYYKRAINEDPKFNRAWTNLGLVYVRKNQYTRAIKTFKQVMTEYEAYNDLGYFIMLDGRLDEAEYFFQKAIDLSPRYFTKAYSNLEQVQMKKRDLWLLQADAQGTKVSTPKKKTKSVKVSQSKTKTLPVKAAKQQVQVSIVKESVVKQSTVAASTVKPSTVKTTTVAASTVKPSSTAKKQHIDAVEFGPKAQNIETIESVQIHEMDAVASELLIEPMVVAVETEKPEPEISKTATITETETEIDDVAVAEVVLEDAEVNSLTANEWEEKAQQLLLTESNEKMQVEDKIEAESPPYHVTLDTSLETAEVNNQPQL